MCYPQPPPNPPSVGSLSRVVTHGVLQLKQKVKGKGLPPGLSPFRRRDPNPGAHIQKKLNRPKGSKGSKYQGQDPSSRQPPHFRGKAGTGMGVWDWDGGDGVRFRRGYRGGMGIWS